MTRFFVTGGSGFVGGHVVRELAGGGHEVRILRREAAAGDGRGAGRGDLGDLQGLRALLADAKPEVVVHAAAHVPRAADEDAGPLFAVNVIGTLNLLDACASSADPPALVYVSSMSVYDLEAPRHLPVDVRHPIAPRDAYGGTKYAGELLSERYAALTGRGVVTLRLPGVYGPPRASGLIHALIRSAATGEPVRVAAPATRRDFAYVKDVARAVALAAGEAARGRSLRCTVSGGAPLTLAAIAELVATVTGRAPVVERGSATGADFYFDPEEAAGLLGYRPRPMRDAIADFWSSLGEGRAFAER